MKEKTTRIIINIDDTGNHPDTILAAIELWKKKRISSVSLMAYGPDFENTVEKLKENPIPMGVHLGANHGSPIMPAHEVPSLCDDQGRFFDTAESILKKYTLEDMEKEFTAQIEKVLASGVKPSFLDSHMGLLYMKRDLRKLHVRLAEKYGLSISLPGHFIFNPSRRRVRRAGFQTSHGLQMEYFLPEDCRNGLEARLNQYEAILRKLPKGLHFFATHPMLPTQAAKDEFPDLPIRKADYELFSSEQWPEMLKNYGVELVSF